MSHADANARLIRAHFEAFNLRDYAKCLATVSDDMSWTNIPFNVAFTGKKSYRDYLENWTTAMPYAAAEIVNIASGDSWSAVEFVGRGTHSGSFIGPRGNVPATHRDLELKCCQMVRIENGLIVEVHVYFDGTTLMSQLRLTAPVVFDELPREASIL